MKEGQVTGSFSLLNEMLAEGEAAAQRREKTAFDHAIESCRGRIVVYGTGELDQRIIHHRRDQGVEPIALTERNPGVWSKVIAGVEVITPEEAAEHFGADSLFLIAVWHRTVSGGLRVIATGLATS